MQQIVTCEPWTTTSSHEDKNWRRTQHTTEFIFKPYHVWIISLYVSAVGRYRTEESIMSGINGMELVLSPWYKASYQICCSNVLPRACAHNCYRPMSSP
jgi:hypothetical protein